MDNASTIPAQRLHQQGISTPLADDPADTVRHLLAVQAQDYYGSLWAVGLRTAGAREADVERAITERRIVRTWPMRGTLHLVAPEDARWMLSLMAVRALDRDRARQEREFGLDARTTGRCAEVVTRLLEGGRQMTRGALYEALAERKIDTEGQRGLHILGRLAHEGLICQGPREGKQPTFVLLDEWIPRIAPLDRDAALAELARRYFAGHGPATVHDLAWWSGLTVRDAQAAVDGAKSALSHHDHDGVRHWFTESPTDPAPAVPTVHLLPPFDEYLVGYKDRSAALDAAHNRQVVGINGLVSPSLVVDGRVNALWKRTLDRQGATLTLTPLRPLRKADRPALARAVQRYGEFIGQPVVLAAD
ncbi:winged helix DNA-binding domain-containing protein [Pseudomonas sp. R2.Fl]|nr:winged helix DNA-binding domain-containing protein [Pseudomonas sp. R2.Fl]